MAEARRMAREATAAAHVHPLNKYTLKNETMNLKTGCCGGGGGGGQRDSAPLLLIMIFILYYDIYIIV